jgi:predicted aspartyl protease
MFPTRRFAVTGLLGSAASAGLAPRVLAQPPPMVETPFAPDEPPTKIDTGRDLHDYMLAPVGINGQGPFQFLIDTGANASCVSHQLADRLVLTAGRPTNVHTMVGVRERPSVLIHKLDVGSRSRRAVSAPSLPIATEGIDGILGIDWLGGQRLVLDFAARTLEITRSKSEASIEGQVLVPARRRMGQLTIVDADLNGRRISAMIDSGSQVTICNRPLRDLVAAQEIRRGDSVTHQKIGLETLAGERFTGEVLYLPFMRLGGLRLGNVPVAYADMHIFNIWNLNKTPALVLGMDLLSQFDAVSMDFGRSNVRFDIAASKLTRL